MGVKFLAHVYTANEWPSGIQPRVVLAPEASDSGGGDDPANKRRPYNRRGCLQGEKRNQSAEGDSSQEGLEWRRNR